MKIHRTHMFSLGIAATLACAIPAFAQELNVLVADAEVDRAEVVPEDEENRYRIGIDCAPAPESLRVHLRLHDDSGLLVNSVMDDSPAGRAGIKRFDVIVEANGEPVASVADLVRAVNTAKDSEMTIALIHEGKELLVKLAPDKRDEDEIERIRNGFMRQLGQGAWPPGMQADLGAQIQDQLEQAFGQMQLPPGQFRFRRLNPGILLDRAQIPNGFNLKMHVERHNNGRATIKIERGDQKWEVTEDELDKLPDDIRPMVENMLNGNRINVQGLMAPNVGQLPAVPKIPGRQTPRRKVRDDLSDRFDGLELKMEELQNAIRSIQGDK